jgi:hypothetical protein
MKQRLILVVALARVRSKFLTEDFIALLSVLENPARSQTLKVCLPNALSREFLIETKKGSPIGKTPIE